MTLPELKPCPFCGGKAELIAPNFGFPFIKCTGRCKTEFDNGIDEDLRGENTDRMFEAWNTRTPDHTALLKQARDVLRRALDDGSHLFYTEYGVELQTTVAGDMIDTITAIDEALITNQGVTE